MSDNKLIIFCVVIFVIVVVSLIISTPNPINNMRFQQETFIPYSEAVQNSLDQNRENELLGLIYPPVAGPRIPSYPSSRPFTAIYKNEPFVVSYNQGVSICP